MNPIDFAVPSIIDIAVSTDDALRSGILSSAISLICAFVTEATYVLLGSPEPF